MHEAGADIRHLRELLGHEDLSTTQICTRVAIKKLQEVRARTHPARMGRDPAPEPRVESPSSSFFFGRPSSSAASEGRAPLSSRAATSAGL